MTTNMDSQPFSFDEWDIDLDDIPISPTLSPILSPINSPPLSPQILPVQSPPNQPSKANKQQTSDDITKYPTLLDFRRADSLVLAGGGMKGVFILGALHYLYTNCGLDHIKAYHGTSIGAAIAMLVLIGYTPIEVMVYLCVHQIPKKIGEIGEHILQKRTLFNSEIVITILNEMIIKKIGKIPTLKELYELIPKDLYMVTVARSDMRTPIYLNHRTHPDLLLTHAIHMSISIPFIFGYASYNGEKYIDGGLLDNFPIVHASSLSSKVFGIDIMTEHCSESDNILLEFITVIMVPLDYIKQINKKLLPDTVKYIELTPPEAGPMQTIDFGTSNAGIQTMFKHGYCSCRETLLKTKKD